TFVEQPPRDRSREAPVPPELRAGALDPLSAVMALSQAVGAGHGCDMTVPVFDGRRRYDMVVADLGQRQLSASGVAGYHGPAQLCSARRVPVAGAGKDPDSNSLWRRPRRGEVVPEHRIDVWIGRPIPGGPAFMVKAQARSDLGPVMIHLAAAEP